MSSGAQYLTQHEATHFRLALVTAMQTQGVCSADVDRVCHYRPGKTAAIVAGRQRIGVHETLQYSEKLGIPPQPWGIETCPQCQAATTSPEEELQPLEDYDWKDVVRYLRTGAALITALLKDDETTADIATPLEALGDAWQRVTPEERLCFLTERLTPNERRAVALCLEEEHTHDLRI